MPRIVTEEKIRNPNAPILVKCSSCKKEAIIEQVVKEEPLPGHYEGAVDVVMVCPHCGFRHHSYYATENLLFQQKRLRVLRNKWDAERIPGDFAAYRRALAMYNELFDRTQKKLGAFVKKETASGRPKK